MRIKDKHIVGQFWPEVKCLVINTAKEVLLVPKVRYLVINTARCVLFVANWVTLILFVQVKRQELPPASQKKKGEMAFSTNRAPLIGVEDVFV